MPYDSEITQRSRDLIVLEKARERIARGWCQHVVSDAAGNVCMMGAFDQWKDFNRLADRLGFPDGVGAVRWNNAPETTQADVLARFDEAIATLSGEPA